MGKKMSMLISLAFAIMSLFTFVGCSSDDDDIPTTGFVRVEFLIGQVLWELVMFMSILQINTPLVTTYALKVRKYAVLKPQTLS